MAASKVFTFNPNTYSFIYRLMDLSVLFFSLSIVTKFYNLTIGHEYLIASLIASVSFLYVAESFGLYRSWRAGHCSEMVLSAWASLCISFMIASLFSLLLQEISLFTLQIAIFWLLLSLLFSSVWRVLQYLYIKYSRKAGFNIKRSVVIGATSSCHNMLDEIKKRDELGYDVVGIYDDRCPDRVYDELQLEVTGKIEEAVKLARSGQIDMLFIALPLKAEKRIGEILLRLGDTTIDVHYIPDLLVSTLVRSRFSSIGDIDTLSVFESPYLGAREWIKRMEDIVLSCLILCLITLPLLLIAIAVKLTSPGPVLFKQRRYGLHGEEIMVWKFRSMSVMEDGGKVTQATKGDVRVTRLGHFLRRTSLDEFPQFFNVLTGSMSIVGPRPHAVAHNEQYRSQVSYYMLRHKVKPGVTGWAQINGWRGETDTLDKMENRVKFDLQYIKNWSIWLDLKIVFLTILRGFYQKNAY